MRNVKINKKVISILASFFILVTPSISKANCKVYDYAKGKVYITDNKNFKKSNDTDIIVIDNRNSDNPDMHIRDSYLIRDLKTQKEILEILLNYEKEDPSNWNRTYNSMLKEWNIHNFLYYLNIEPERTNNVDLDNEDEYIYKYLF